MTLRTILVLRRVLLLKNHFFWSTSNEAGVVPQYNSGGLALSRQQALNFFMKQLFHATSSLFLSEEDMRQISQPYNKINVKNCCFLTEYHLAYSKVTHTKQKKYFHHLKRRG